MNNLFSTSLIASAMLLGAVAAPIPARAAGEPSIPVIVKDTTSFYWQIVLAGARKAGKDLARQGAGARRPVRIRHQRPDHDPRERRRRQAGCDRDRADRSSRRSASRSTRRRRSVQIIGIDCAANCKAFTIFLTTDNVQGGRVAADALAAAIKAKYGKAEGDVALITIAARRRFARSARTRASRSSWRPNIPGLKLVADKVADGQATTGLNIMTDLHHQPTRTCAACSRPISSRRQGAGQAIAENKRAEHDQAGRLRQRRQAGQIPEDGIDLPP